MEAKGVGRTLLDSGTTNPSSLLQRLKTVNDLCVLKYDIGRRPWEKLDQKPMIEKSHFLITHTDMKIHERILHVNTC